MLITQLLTCDLGCLVTKCMLMLVISMDINCRSQSHCQIAPETRKRHEMVIWHISRENSPDSTVVKPNGQAPNQWDMSAVSYLWAGEVKRAGPETSLNFHALKQLPIRVQDSAEWDTAIKGLSMKLEPQNDAWWLNHSLYGCRFFC